MQEQNKNQILREKVILRYVQALDQGDLEEVAAVLEVTLNDPDLDQMIAEVNRAYHEEEQLTWAAADAQVVRDLLHKHLPSAFDVEEPDDRPLTIGDVAARLQADRRVPAPDQEVNRLLLGSPVPLPTWLSVRAVKQLIADLGITVSDRFLRVFRDTAIMLGMGYSHSQAQLTAAREERVRRAPHKESEHVSKLPNSDAVSEEDE